MRHPKGTRQGRKAEPRERPAGSITPNTVWVVGDVSPPRVAIMTLRVAEELVLAMASIDRGVERYLDLLWQARSKRVGAAPRRPTE